VTIEVDRLGRTFVIGRRQRRRVVEAVRDLTLSVDAGERLAFIGPNGAGKSTSIKLLTGILEPTAGTTRVLGLVPWVDRRRLAGRIGTLFGQRSQLWLELTPRQSFRMLGAIFGVDDATLAARTAALADLLDADGLFDAPGGPCRSASGCAASWRPACCTSRRSCSSTSRPSGSTRSASAASGSCCSG
jgi:ABC-2 type transport system ATP-binding protein